MDIPGCRTRSLCALLITVSVIAAGCGSSPPNRSSANGQTKHVPPGITPAQAVAIVRTYFRKEDAAEKTWSQAQQNQIEMPPQSQIDDMGWSDAKNLHESPPKKLPSPNLPVIVWVPRGAQDFAALANRVYMLFINQAGHWQQASSPSEYSGAPTADVARDSAGYAIQLTPADYGSLRFSPAQVVARFVADLNASVKSGVGVKDAAFANGPLTSGNFTTFATMDKPHMYEINSMTAAPAPQYVTAAFRLKNGGALAFITVATTYVARGAHGGSVLVSPKETSLAGIIQPGRYQMLKIQALMDLTVVIPPKGSSAGVEVLGESYGGVNYTFH